MGSRRNTGDLGQTRVWQWGLVVPDPPLPMPAEKLSLRWRGKGSVEVI